MNMILDIVEKNHMDSVAVKHITGMVRMSSMISTLETGQCVFFVVVSTLVVF